MYSSELVQHYREVRKRLDGSPIRVVPPVKQVELVVVLNEPPPPPPVVPEPSPIELQPMFVPIITRKNKMMEVIKQIIEAEGMVWGEVFAYNRIQKYVVIRRKVWAWLHSCKMTVMQIAKFCRPEQPYDHTTIIYGLKAFYKNPVQLPPPILCGTIQPHQDKNQMETAAL